MTLSPETPTASSTSPRRRRSTVALAAALGTAAVLGLGVAGTTAAFADTSTPAPSATSSPSEHVGLHRHAIRRELADAVHSGTNFATRMQKLAATIIDKHPASFAKLPAELQTDLTALKNAKGDDVTTAATAIKTKALNGGYGERVQKFAERVQSRTKK